MKGKKRKEGMRTFVLGPSASGSEERHQEGSYCLGLRSMPILPAPAFVHSSRYGDLSSHTHQQHSSSIQKGMLEWVTTERTAKDSGVIMVPCGCAYEETDRPKTGEE